MFGNETECSIDTNNEENRNEEHQSVEEKEKNELQEQAEQAELQEQPEQAELQEQPEQVKTPEPQLEQSDSPDQPEILERLEPEEPQQKEQQQPEQMESDIHLEQTIIVENHVPKTEPEFLNESFELPSLESLDHSPIPFTTPYKVKDPIILLERCDKIWETLKLIKGVQCIDNSKGNLPKGGKSPGNMSEKSSTKYVKYQPVLNNGNSSLPNFKLAVKSMKKLFHCHICGKEYSENRSLRHHSLKIHGVFIPIKQRKKMSDSSDGNEKGNSMTEHDNSEQRCSKEDLNKTESTRNQGSSISNVNNTKTLSPRNRKRDSRQSFPPPMMEDIEIKSEEGTFEPEKQQNARRSRKRKTTVDNSVICALCKQKTKSIRAHLIQYHKIQCPNIMIKELKNMIQNETTPREKLILEEMCDSLESGDSTIPDKEEPVIKPNPRRNVQKQNVQPNREEENRRKRKYLMELEELTKRPRPMPNADMIGSKYQCDICQGIYRASGSFNKHKQKHIARGETRENIDTSKFRYVNSPFYVRGIFNITQSLKIEENSLDDSNEQEDELMELLTEDEKETTRNCECGKTFRNPHTFFLHKANCKFTGPDEIDPNIARNSSDRDSGIGISITIKKKNDSYEVVNRDGDEAKSKDSGNSDLSSDVSDFIQEDSLKTLIPQKNTAVIDVESTYSTNHKILKLEAIDEDIDVDVESDIQKNKHLDEIPIDGSLKMRDMCTRILSKAKLTSRLPRPQTSSAITNSFLSCTCGKTFKNLKNLNMHTIKCHPLLLMCGYCNVKFSGMGGYNRHLCDVNEGGELIKPSTQYVHQCPSCNISMRTIKEFDSHIRAYHLNPKLPFQCYKCPKRLASRTDRKVHFHENHSLDFCTICSKEMHVNAKWKHEGYHFGLGYPCHLCKKAYAVKQNLRRHLHTVHNKQLNSLVFCILCAKQLSTKTFVRHVYEHYDKEICRLCRSVFRNEESLMNHIMVEHAGKYALVKCNICGMSFLNNAILDEHLKKCEVSELADDKTTMS